jgi:hypothetical protein
MNVVEGRNDKVLQLDIGGKVSLPDIEFEPYQPGLRTNVLIHLLFDNKKDDPNGSDAALIKYLPGAFIRAPGTTHEMRTTDGCTFLAMRDIPVKQLT